MNTVKHRRLLLATIGIVSLVWAINAQNPTPNVISPAQLSLMPKPASVQPQPGRLPITSGFTVAVKNFSDDRLRSGIARMVRRLEGRTVLTLPADLATDEAAATLVVQCEGAGEIIPSLNENESYSLEINDKQARLAAPTVVGVLRGLETFLQLLHGDRDGFFMPAIRINDQPRFPWRGLLIDVARHYEPIEVLKRNLDAMAAVKLNVFHWHLSENQGFRVESKKFPKLTALGSDGLFYTQSEVRDLIAYAYARGIRVVPEFDMPGHSTAWFVGYPDLASGPGPYEIERKWGFFDPAMDPTRDETYKFLDTFIGEMAGLFPDQFFHIGGDEVNGKQWDANPKIQQFMHAHNLKNNNDLQAYFNQRVQKIVSKHGKTMLGWDEILRPDLPSSIAIQSWRGPDSLAQAAKQGYRGLLSSGYYVDLMWSAERHYLTEPLSGAAA